jgi:hypothetical protein
MGDSSVNGSPTTEEIENSLDSLGSIMMRITLDRTSSSVREIEAIGNE